MNDIEAILKATIQTKVIEAFNTAPDVVEKLVQAALSKEVNEFGAKPDYHDKKMPFMEFLVGEEIRRAVTECVRDYIKGNKDAIRAKVEQAVIGSDFSGPLAKALGDVLTRDFAWSASVNVNSNR